MELDLRTETLGLPDEKKIKKALPALRKKSAETKKALDKKIRAYDKVRKPEFKNVRESNQAYQKWLHATKAWKDHCRADGELRTAEGQLESYGKAFYVSHRAREVVMNALKKADADLSHVRVDFSQGKSQDPFSINTVVVTDFHSFHYPKIGKRRAVLKLKDGRILLSTILKAIQKINGRYADVKN